MLRAVAPLLLITGLSVPGNAVISEGLDAGTAAGISVLSNRADLISGGDALVEVELAPATKTADVVVRLGLRDVTPQFAMRPNGRLMGRVTGLAVGANTLTARIGGVTHTLDIVNHPNGGPIFSGPQIQPWTCQDTAVDAQCNQPAEYTYLYKTTDPRTTTVLQPYDPANPPSDVATTTTDEGVTVPFIVRQERGYQDRDEYKILTLFQPDKPWAPWSPQEQWNHKLLITHGGNCGTAHGPSGAPLRDYAGTLPENPALTDSYIVALGKGFAVLSTALDNLGHNCNVVPAAESLLMAKERLIEQYGELRYTIGTGCSGGSITQAMVANAYPGIYQGLLTTCAYPDVASTAIQFFDLHMLRLYFEDPSKWGAGVVWTPQQMADVEGHIAHANAILADELFFKTLTDPSADCVSEARRYNAQTNPGGVRCGLLDYLINVLGPRPREVWSANEKAIVRGFAGNFMDNVGVQYGLDALRRGLITPAQFIDLNAKIGGLDIDGEFQPERTVADLAALANVYRSGELNETNNLNRVAIINAIGADPGAAHDSVHAWWVRWRLDREHGNHDNHVMWGGPAPLVGDTNYPKLSLEAIDRWLAAVEQDHSATPLAAKLTARKPADVHDQCSDGAGHKILDSADCVPIFSAPRVVAGDAKTADIVKCRLRSLSRSDDYGLLAATFTDGQWGQLEEIFAGGVCDFEQPGVGQQGAVEWMSYGDAAAHIYGGRALSPRPARSGGGWASAAFQPAPSRVAGLRVEPEPEPGPARPSGPSLPATGIGAAPVGWILLGAAATLAQTLRRRRPDQAAPVKKVG
ncbi:MAG: DUF6351 family protein [Actinomycetota bacterium]